MKGEPQLAAPGAGLSWLQHLMAKYYYGPWVARRSDLRENAQSFEAVQGQILQIAREMPAQKLHLKVLVPRLPGLEDSSRYWSALMTMEHLLIVGEDTKDVILQLMKDQDPASRFSIAALKPKGKRHVEETFEHFERFTKTCMSEILPLLEERDSRLKQTHPWFGPLRARQWQWYLAVHARIHYRQMKNIRKLSEQQ